MFSIRWPSPSGILPEVGDAIRSRAGRWAKKRQGPDKTTIRLAAGRTYILPTGVGLIYALMTFAMLLGSMNYNNNLSFLLTFLLISLGFVAMHQCQRNLLGLEIRYAGVDPVFEGEPLVFRFAITNHSRAMRFRIELGSDQSTGEPMDIPPGESRIFTVALATTRRGYASLERFRVRSLFPFELFRAWAWGHMDVQGLVYPRPAEHAPRPPAALSALGHRQHDARGEEDFAGLRRFVEGDSPRNVAWKAFARSGQLLSKRFAGADTSSQWFDLDDAPGNDLEERLRLLTRWVLDADRTGEDYGVRLAGVERQPSHGETHRSQCLEMLALFEPGHAQA